MKTLSPWREKPRDKLRIILLYKIEITTLKNITWVKKLSFSFHSLLSFSLCIFSYPPYFSLLFLLALTHGALSPHTLGLHSFFPSAQMAEWPLPFISFTFSSFLPFTLLIKSQSMQATYFDFTSTKSLFINSAMTEWVLLLLLSFLSSFSVSNTPISQPTMLTFVHHEEKLHARSMSSWQGMWVGSWCSAPNKW